MARIVNFKSMDNLVANRKTEPYLNLTMIPGVTPGNSWWGCATQFSKSWPYFRPKKCHFHTRFQTWHLKKLCHHIVRLQRQQKDFSIIWSISNEHISLLSFSFGIETINTFICSSSFLENHTFMIPDQNGRTTPIFISKPSKNHTLWGGTYLEGKYKGVTPLTWHWSNSKIIFLAGDTGKWSFCSYLNGWQTDWRPSF